MWQRLLPRFTLQADRKKTLHCLSVMKERTFSNPNALHHRARRLQEQVQKNRAREALLRVLEARRMSKMMRNIRTKSCANLMQLMVAKQRQRKAIAVRKLALRSRGP